MTKRKVVVSGLGVVSSIGIGYETFSESLRAGRSGISEIRGFDPAGFPSCHAGEVHRFSPAGAFVRLDRHKVGRTSQMAVAATGQAFADAGLSRADVRKMRCGTVFGTTDGECQVIERLIRSGLADDPSSSGEAATFFSADTIASTVASEFALTGDAIVLSTACAAGNYAIGHAYDQIVSGAADVVVCGGANSLSRKTYAGFTRLGAVAPEKCQPFDRHRKGIIPGEGAAALVIEDYQRARARGATVYAEVLGYAVTCDAKHMVAPDADSIARCMRIAHTRAGIEAGDVDYVCAHGTGTPTNDVVEATAIRNVFGHPPPTSSIKSMIGHTMGAASALAAVACCFSLTNGVIPPTINFSEADPRCQLDCVPNNARNATLAIVQNNGFAFGGNNAVVLFSHPGDL